jgi:hypothetical protein
VFDTGWRLERRRHDVDTGLVILLGMQSTFGPCIFILRITIRSLVSIGSAFHSESGGGHAPNDTIHALHFEVVPSF